MTAVVGLRCSDGIVICADRQVSSPDYHKYYERKISVECGSGWGVIFAYAGLPQLAKEAKEKMAKTLEDIEIGYVEGNVSPEKVQEIADDILTDMGRHYADLNLQMLMAVSTIQTLMSNSLDMFLFDGHGLHRAEGFSYLGLADSSLIRFIADAVYSPSISTKLGTRLGIYMIEKAKHYLDHCGGATDVMVIKKGNKWYPQDEVLVNTLAKSAPDYEQKYLRQIIRKLNIPGFPKPPI